MNIHKNARLTPVRREEMASAVLAGQLSKARAARDYGVCPKIVTRWTTRFLAEGRDGMQDRSWRPKLIPKQTAPVSRVLRRAGLSRIKDLAPPEPVVRYEYKEPGGLIHLDIKKLGRHERVGHRITGDRKGQSNARGVGWEYVHICIDDASRVAVTGIFPDEKAVSAIAALQAAVAYYQSLGIINP